MARRKNRKIFPPPRPSPRRRKKKDRKRREYTWQVGNLLPVGRLRERQHQIAAQKRNEAFLKYTSHTQTARYFERECGNAKHYNSWSHKDYDPKKLVDKAKKEARLAIRKKALSDLLKEEQEAYRKELHELSSRKKQKELASLDNFKENRVEQSTYLVKTGRRYSYSPKSSISTLLTDTEERSQRFSPSTRRDSPNSDERSELSSLYQRLRRRSNMDRCESFLKQDNVERSHCTNVHFTPSETENLTHHSTRHSSRPHDKSLENRNTRREGIPSEDANVPDQPEENPAEEEGLMKNSNIDQAFLKQDNVNRSHCTNMHFTSGETENLTHHSTRHSSRPLDNSWENTNMRRDYIPSVDANVSGQPEENPAEEEGVMRNTNIDQAFLKQDNVNRSHCTNMHFTSGETENLTHHSTRHSSRPYDRSWENTNMTRQTPSQPEEYSVHEKSTDSQEFKESEDGKQEKTEQDEKNDDIDEEDQVDRAVTPNTPEDDLREKIHEEHRATNARDKAGQMVTDHRQFESEKSMPWLRMIPNDKNLSEQMFLYLTHQEMMHQIEDLTRRESHACTKQSWDEALRLRDMRNRLELLREKRLFNMDSLKMDEEIRSLGLESIEKRAEELALREEACTNSTMYSEEAKELWKRWVQEDEKSPIKLARQKREDIMKDLEIEWRNLAIDEKDKISRSHNESSAQNESGQTANSSHGKTKSVLHPAIY